MKHIFRYSAYLGGFLYPLLFSFVAGAEEKQISFAFHPPSLFKINRQRFDLSTDCDMEKLNKAAANLIARHASHFAGADPSLDRPLLSGRDLRGLKELRHLTTSYDAESATTDKGVLRQQILEIAAAIANNHRARVPSYVGLPDLPFRFAAALRNPVARGRREASNLPRSDEAADPSALDPVASTYWRRPASIPAADLYTGFDRSAQPAFDDRIWNYSGPKKSGGNPGYELSHGSERLKVKFAEVHSEPFISRIFHALGYYVDPTDYAPSIKVRYDRRLLTEFNLRTPIKMKIGVLFIPIYTFHFEGRYDPFTFIEHAVFRNGTRVAGTDLRRLLLRETTGRHPDLRPENFRAEVEAEIDYLVATPANVQLKQPSRNIGPWDFGRLAREDLREVRAAGVLAAWVGWWDSSFENTRLRVINSGSRKELRHFFSDLGSGLARSGGTFRHSSEQPNDFPWTFTDSTTARRNGKHEPKFKITNYQPIAETPAFREITRDDARWMARLIGQLSEEQIVGALIASGFPSAEVRIYTEKLLVRRDRLIRDTGLATEFPPLRRAADHSPDYDPVQQGPVSFRTKQGLKIQAPLGTNRVSNGRVEPRRPNP